MLFEWSESVPWLQSALSGSDEVIQTSHEGLSLQGHVLVCGYGRVGQNIVKLLQSANYPVLVIDQDEQLIQGLRDAKIPYLYGNPASPNVLEKAQVTKATGMAIALPDPMNTRLCLKRSLELAPELDVIVQAENDKDIELLYQLGAKEVVQPEFEASLELSSHLLSGLGLPDAAIREQIAEIRTDHYLDLRAELPAEAIARNLRQAVKEMNSRWFTLEAPSPAIGLSLGQLDLRRLTGVTLMAIMRPGGEELDYPDQQTILQQADRLLVVGQTEELQAFEALITGEMNLPIINAACQWLPLPAQSQVVGKTLADLNLGRQYRVFVQAIRREGKLIRFPAGETRLQAGDSLLLFGAATDLPILESMMMATPLQLEQVAKQTEPIEAEPITIEVTIER
jgi:CPA2 family monovalent cation:H+ antiporter-2